MFYLYFAAKFSLDYHFIIFNVIFFHSQATPVQLLMENLCKTKDYTLEVFHRFGGEPNKTLYVNQWEPLPNMPQ